MFRIARFLFPKPPRHASPVGTGRKRNPAAPPKTTATMTARPRPDYTVPAGLRHVPKSQDGQTALFHRIDETIVAPAGSGDATVSFQAVADGIDPHLWYPELPLPPSQVGTFDNPTDRTPPELRAMRAGIPAAFGHSALTHTARPTDAWFRAELADAARDNSLRAFHRRTAEWLNGGTVPAQRGEVGQVLDTRIFTTVGTAQFGADAQSGATR